MAFIEKVVRGEDRHGRPATGVQRIEIDEPQRSPLREAKVMTQWKLVHLWVKQPDGSRQPQDCGARKFGIRCSICNPEGK